jgi:hypothetical protein
VLKLGLLIGSIALASSVSAQSIFVQASVGADLRRFSAEPEKSAFDGTASSLALAVGSEFIPHWLVGAEFDFGGRSTTSTTTPVVIFNVPRDIHNSYASRRRSLSALAGYATDVHRRARVGFYGGLSFTTFRREIVSDAESVVLQSAAPGSVFEERLTGAIVGADVAIRAGAHVAIVPAIRAQGLRIGTELGGHSLRPSIGLRISF